MATKAEIDSFLIDTGWDHASCAGLAPGFSTRQFARLRREGAVPETAILMCSKPDQKTDAFVDVAHLLRRINIAAPEVYASDVMRGLVLMQDFGDEPVGALLDKGADRAPFDAKVARILADLHKNFSESMLGAAKTPLYNAALFTDQLKPFLDHYFPLLFHRAPTVRERSSFVEAWHGALSPLDALPRTLVMRDFMPDNAMSLSLPVLGRDIGILDFQDSGIGCVAYDLASWCEEVRRDGGLGRMKDFVAAYHALNPVVELQELNNAVNIYAAQRHTRILGLLVTLDRKEMIPRVWRVLQELVKHEPLAPVRRWFLSCRPQS